MVLAWWQVMISIMTNDPTLFCNQGSLCAQIAKFMGPPWGPPGSWRTQMAPCWPHEPCYQGGWGAWFVSTGQYLIQCRTDIYNAAFGSIYGIIIVLTFTCWSHNLMVSCQKGPTRHAYAWQIGPFLQDTIDICTQDLLSLLCLQMP